MASLSMPALTVSASGSSCQPRACYVETTLSYCHDVESIENMRGRGGETPIQRLTTPDSTKNHAAHAAMERVRDTRSEHTGRYFAMQYSVAVSMTSSGLFPQPMEPTLEKIPNEVVKDEKRYQGTGVRFNLVSMWAFRMGILRYPDYLSRNSRYPSVRS